MKWPLRRSFMPYQSLISSRSEEDLEKASVSPRRRLPLASMPSTKAIPQSRHLEGPKRVRPRTTHFVKRRRADVRGSPELFAGPC